MARIRLLLSLAGVAALALPATAAAAPSCSASGPGLNVRSGETRWVTIRCESTGPVLDVEVTDGPDHVTTSPRTWLVSSTSKAMTFEVTGNPGYVGADAISFRGRDGSGWSVAVTAAMQVRDPAANGPPGCAAWFPTTRLPAGMSTDLLFTCSDPDGDAYELVPSALRFATAVGDGLLADTEVETLRKVRFTGSPSYVGEVPFTVAARDDRGATSPPVPVTVLLGVLDYIEVFPPAGPSPRPSPPAGYYQDVQPPGAGASAAPEQAAATLVLGKLPRLRTALKRGLRVRVRARRAGTAQVRITVDGATAKRLQLSKQRKAVTVARTKAKLEPGKTRTLRLRFTTRARRALGRSKRVRVTLRVTVGTSKAVTRRVTLKR